MEPWPSGAPSARPRAATAPALDSSQPAKQSTAKAARPNKEKKRKLDANPESAAAQSTAAAATAQKAGKQKKGNPLANVTAAPSKLQAPQKRQALQHEGANEQAVRQPSDQAADKAANAPKPRKRQQTAPQQVPEPQLQSQRLQPPGAVSSGDAARQQTALEGRAQRPSDMPASQTKPPKTNTTAAKKGQGKIANRGQKEQQQGQPSSDAAAKRKKAGAKEVAQAKKRKRSEAAAEGDAAQGANEAVKGVVRAQGGDEQGTNAPEAETLAQGTGSAAPAKGKKGAAKAPPDKPARKRKVCRHNVVTLLELTSSHF